MLHFALLGLVYLAFISLGLPDGVLGVAWPAMRATLGQPLATAGLVTLILALCSAASGFASAAVLKRFGVGRVVAASAALTGLALAGFAQSQAFFWILLLAVPLGLGAGSVDAGLNHFVAAHYSSRHMNWLHGCWGIGATLGPFIMGRAMAGAGGWQDGYRTIATLQLSLALLFFLSLGLWQRERAPAPQAAGSDPPLRAHDAPAWAAWLAPALYFVYATVEVGTGLWAASILVDPRGLDEEQAALWVAGFFGAIMAGRFGVGLVAARWGNRALVRAGLLIALAGATLFSFGGLPHAVSLAGLVLLGLGCAPVYPSLMHETTRRFEPAMARTVIGRQVAFAALGTALGPGALGLLGAAFGLASIMPAVAAGLVLLLLLTRLLDRHT